MSNDLFGQLITALFAGAGLVLAGGVNLLLRRRPFAVRAGVLLLTAGAALAGAWAFDGDTTVVERAGAILAFGIAACLLAGSGLAAALCRPGACGAALAVAGLALAVGGVVRYDLADQAALTEQALDLELLVAQPVTTPNTSLARTDRGTLVTLQETTAPRPGAELRRLEDRVLASTGTREQVMRSQPADDRTNCHGWVFTGGRYWVAGAEVDRILAENGYYAVSDPRPDDLAVYRAGGTVAHTAVVRYVTPGQPVLVEGKWGCTGVFVHGVDRSTYGTEFTYYRTHRAGHVLAGLPGAPSPTPVETARTVIPTLDNPDEFTE